MKENRIFFVGWRAPRATQQKILQVNQFTILSEPENRVEIAGRIPTMLVLVDLTLGTNWPATQTQVHGFLWLWGSTWVVCGWACWQQPCS
jgi:hypothetical protein